MLARIYGGFILSALICASASAASFEELRKRAELVQREYDLPLAEALMGELQFFVKENSGGEPHLTLAHVALLVAELRRMDYETTNIEPREKRLLGRRVNMRFDSTLYHRFAEPYEWGKTDRRV